MDRRSAQFEATSYSNVPLLPHRMPNGILTDMAKKRTTGKSTATGGQVMADAKREAAAFYKRTGRIIKLLTVQEILDEKHVQKM